VGQRVIDRSHFSIVLSCNLQYNGHACATMEVRNYKVGFYFMVSYILPLHRLQRTKSSLREKGILFFCCSFYTSTIPWPKNAMMIKYNFFKLQILIGILGTIYHWYWCHPSCLFSFKMVVWFKSCSFLLGQLGCGMRRCDCIVIVVMLQLWKFFFKQTNSKRTNRI